MRIFKHISFREGLDCSLSEFKKTFAIHLIKLSASEVKAAHKIATNGNISRRPKKSKESNTSKDN